jgi:hypothetical protein
MKPSSLHFADPEPSKNFKKGLSKASVHRDCKRSTHYLLILIQELPVTVVFFFSSPVCFHFPHPPLECLMQIGDCSDRFQTHHVYDSHVFCNHACCPCSCLLYWALFAPLSIVTWLLSEQKIDSDTERKNELFSSSNESYEWSMLQFMKMRLCFSVLLDKGSVAWKIRW